MSLLKGPIRKTHYEINTPLCPESDKFEIVYSERMQEHICFHTFEQLQTKMVLNISSKKHMFQIGKNVSLE